VACWSPKHRVWAQVSYHLNKTYRMHDGSMRSVDYVVPVDNVTRREVRVPGLRFNTHYTFLVSLVADEHVFLPQRFSLRTDVKRTFLPALVSARVQLSGSQRPPSSTRPGWSTRASTRCG